MTSNTQNYNRFSYVLNNPLKYTDPSGYIVGPPRFPFTIMDKRHYRSGRTVIWRGFGFSDSGDGRDWYDNNDFYSAFQDFSFLNTANLESYSAGSSGMPSSNPGLSQSAVVGGGFSGSVYSNSIHPTIMINFVRVPKNFSKQSYMNQLQSRLIENGFNPNLQVVPYSDWIKLKNLMFSVPTSTVTFRGHSRGDKYSLITGGFAQLNSPNSAVVYPGLSSNINKDKGTIPIWLYVNVTMHELGHSLLGFNHEKDTGYTDYSEGIMDYRGVLRQGANFSPIEQLKIKQSIWGR